MSTVRIVTDSACDLDEADTAALQIDVVPLSIRFGNEEFVDRKDLTPKEFWRRVAASPVLPETAAPSPGAFEEAFRRAVHAGATTVICINLSSKLSATYASAELAASSLRPEIDVRVIDSLSITMGQGSMVRTAARMAANGASAEEIVTHVQAMTKRTHVYGALDTLDNLKKGGRIGGAKALIGSLLSVKPLLDISSGAVEELGKQRTRSKALAHLTSMVMQAKTEHGAIENLAVMHGDADDADQIIDQLSVAFPRDQIVTGQIGAVIGTHGGPRVVGITFNLPVK
jgi:DegV family protein with EDD domain